MKSVKARKKYLRNAVGAMRARPAPARTPTSIPGVIARTIGQSTDPWRSCVRKLDHEPAMIAASDVPIARCMT
jgi:hypothetical protein